MKAIDCLVRAINSSDAILCIYKCRKAAQRKISLAGLCKAAKIPSTGYLSDVMHGKRKLTMKYQESIIEALNLDEREAAVLRLMFEIDHTKSPTKRWELKQKLDVTLRSVLFHRVDLLRDAERSLFAGDVLCAMGFFDRRASFTQLCSVFPNRPTSEVDDALKLLRELRVIEVADSGLFQVAQDRLNFMNEQNPGIGAMLRLRAQESMERAEHFFGKKDSLLVSYSASVRKTDLERFYKQLDFRAAESLTKIESHEPDTVIRLNIFSYPVMEAGRCEAKYLS